MAPKLENRLSKVKVSFDDFVVSNYTSAHLMQLVRSAKQRAGLKNVPFAGLDPLYLHTVEELQRNGFRCNCCRKEFRRKDEGKGGGGKDSLSLHRVVASAGYIPENIRVICQACNNAIGETNNQADIAARFAALHWQEKVMARAS
jgi:hypothetical protein